ncbi:MAG: hypothetical protein QME35_06600 [Thermoanaerobacteraceae bacterium]|nr:hypothetical protein [Thermoanaerobacteraceae bacterium]
MTPTFSYYFMTFLNFFAALATPIAAIVFVTYYIIINNKKMKMLASIEKSIYKISGISPVKDETAQTDFGKDLNKDEEDK